MSDSITGKELGEKLLESVKQMKAGKGTVVHSPVAEARLKSGLSQSQFSVLMGVSIRTLQDWEQGRRKPSGAAVTLLRIAFAYPKVLHKLVATDGR